MATSSEGEANDELTCRLCMGLFQDPRNLSCLHTFCRECIEGSLAKSQSLIMECPLCRAKHELKDGAGLLPVNEYVRQELPLKRVQRQLEFGGDEQECKSCAVKAKIVAWCTKCDMICQTCAASHQRMANLRLEHDVVTIEPKASFEQRAKFPVCLRHKDQKLKCFCKLCKELVCSDCLISRHRDHPYCMADEIRHSLQSKVEELFRQAEPKKEEFSRYLGKVGMVEGNALEYSELMKSEVNNVFDGIVASVEAQRNEALQSVSQGAKKIWAQKEMMEVSLAQLDSFTRFINHTHKCTTDASYVAMATQCIKLMERLKSVHGDMDALCFRMMPLGFNYSSEDVLQVPLDKIFALDKTLSLEILPVSGTQVKAYKGTSIKITVTLMVGDFPVVYPSILQDRCQLVIEAELDGKGTEPPEVHLVHSHKISWELNDIPSYGWGQYKIDVKCKFSRDGHFGNPETIATEVATYTFLFS